MVAVDTLILLDVVASSINLDLIVISLCSSDYDSVVSYTFKIEASCVSCMLVTMRCMLSYPRRLP
jgi:hypothetical protein